LNDVSRAEDGAEAFAHHYAGADKGDGEQGHAPDAKAAGDVLAAA